RPKVEGSTTSTTGYGIQDNGSVSTIIHNGDFYRNRRGVDFSGTIPSRLGKVIACKVSTTPEMYPTSSGFGTHGTAEHIEFIDNDVSNVFNGFFLRGGDIH